MAESLWMSLKAKHENIRIERLYGFRSTVIAGRRDAKRLPQKTDTLVVQGIDA
jgi:hypothetical protein